MSMRPSSRPTGRAGIATEGTVRRLRRATVTSSSRSRPPGISGRRSSGGSVISRPDSAGSRRGCGFRRRRSTSRRWISWRRRGYGSPFSPRTRRRVPGRSTPGSPTAAPCRRGGRSPSSSTTAPSHRRLPSAISFRTAGSSRNASSVRLLPVTGRSSSTSRRTGRPTATTGSSGTWRLRTASLRSRRGTTPG
jgi:hypothetical protein